MIGSEHSKGSCGGRNRRVWWLNALVLGLSGCGGGAGGGATGGQPPPQVPDLTITVAASVEVGQGLISPYRIAGDEQRDDRMFVLTGRGETFSEGRLHAVEPAGLKDLAPPIDIGINGADFAQDATYLVVAVRGSNRIVLVDTVGWKTRDSLTLDFPPIAVAPLGAGEFAVASATTGALVIVRRAGERLEIARRTSLGTFAYDVVADPSAQRIYVSMPLRGVDVLDAQSLKTLLTVRLAGEASRGILVWRDYVVVSNRDGYLHFLSNDGATVQTLDVAVALGLDRATLAARGIDCGDVLDVGGGRLVVINNRQDSLLLEASPGGEVPVRVLARLGGGAFGAYRISERTLYVTLPGVNAVDKVVLPAQVQPAARLKESRLVTGSEIVDVAPLPGATAAAAAMQSSGAIGIFDSSAIQLAEFRPPVGETWVPPLITASTRGLLFVSRRSSGAEELLYLDRQGAVVGRFPINIGPVFAAVESDGTAMLISRINRKVQFFDLATGQTQSLRLQHDRPRLAARLGADSWVVLHDTTPDIGVTLLRMGQEAAFDPFDDWFSGVVGATRRGVVTASFNGSLGIINSVGRLGNVRRTGIGSLSDLRIGNNDTIWATAENSGLAYRIRLSDMTADGRYRRNGLHYISALPGSSLLLSATARQVELLSE